MRIGVISDTHGVVPPGVHTALAGVSLILHAGDIGGDRVMAELAMIARVVAVRGNTDRDLEPPLFPDTRRLTLEGVTIFLCHEPARTADAGSADVIITGHTHQAKIERRDHALWLNPGTAGKRQFGQTELTAAILTVQDGKAEAEIVRVD